jgi:hypothetical protein
MASFLLVPIAAVIVFAVAARLIAGKPRKEGLDDEWWQAIK